MNNFKKCNNFDMEDYLTMLQDETKNILLFTKSKVFNSFF